MRSEKNDATAFELAAGVTAVVGTAFITAFAVRPTEPAVRATLMAMAVALVSALITNWRAAAGTALAAILVFTGFLAHHYGVLTGDPAPWAYAPLVALAVPLGRAYRRLTRPAGGPLAAAPDLAPRERLTATARPTRHSHAGAPRPV